MLTREPGGRRLWAHGGSGQSDASTGTPKIAGSRCPSSAAGGPGRSPRLQVSELALPLQALTPLSISPGTPPHLAAVPAVVLLPSPR